MALLGPHGGLVSVDIPRKQLMLVQKDRLRRAIAAGNTDEFGRHGGSIVAETALAQIEMLVAKLRVLSTEKSAKSSLLNLFISFPFVLTVWHAATHLINS